MTHTLEHTATEAHSEVLIYSKCKEPGNRVGVLVHVWGDIAPPCRDRVCMIKSIITNRQLVLNVWKALANVSGHSKVHFPPCQLFKDVLLPQDFIIFFPPLCAKTKKWMAR